MGDVAASASQRAAAERRLITLFVFVLLCIGFLIVIGISSLPLVSQSPRTLTFATQDIPPYVRYAAFSTPFWLQSGESIVPDLTDTALNATSGTEVWRGPPVTVFLHLPLNETGPTITSATVAPADGYYVLEVHHNDCQTEVELCPFPAEGIVFETQGTAVVYPVRPYAYLPPSTALIADVTALAGLGVSAWFVSQWRSDHALRVRDVAKRAANHPLAVTFVALGIVAASAGSVGVYYASHLEVRVLGMGAIWFATEQPCVPGQPNSMFVYVWAYNAADEYVDIVLGVVINGTTYAAGASNVWPRSWTSTATLVTSYDCKDPAARLIVLSETPAWL